MTGIVILNYNHFNDVAALVRRIEPFSAVDRIVVVDNASTDGSGAGLLSLQSPKTAVLMEKQNGGYAKGNNAGLRYLAREAECDMLFVANPDVIFTNEAVEQVVAALKAHPEYGAMAPQMLTCDGEIVPMRGTHHITYGETLLSALISESLVQSRYLEYHPLNTKGILDQRMVWGCFFALSREAAEKCGYLDEHTFLYREEEILGRRLMNAGYRLGFLGNCSFVHNHVYCAETTAFKMRSLKICQASELYFWKTYEGLGPIRFGLLWLMQRVSRPLHRLKFTFSASLKQKGAAV